MLFHLRRRAAKKNQHLARERLAGGLAAPLVLIVPDLSRQRQAAERERHREGHRDTPDVIHN